MDHISINPELIIEQKSEDVILHAKNHRYELPRNKFIDLLKKSQDSVMYEEDECWFPDHKTFDIIVEEIKSKQLPSLSMVKKGNTSHSFHGHQMIIQTPDNHMSCQ